MNLSKNFIVSILGMGFLIGSLVNTLDFPILIMFSIGFGVFAGGIFREIKQTNCDKKSNQSSEST